MHIRFVFLYLVLILATIALIARLFFWQVVKSSDLSSQARGQHQSGRNILADRGSILASDGSLLATSTQGWLLFVQKREIKDSPRAIANKLAPLLVEDPENEQALLDEAMRIEGLLAREDLSWIPVKHKIPTEVKKNVEALDIAGIGFDPEEARFYPEGSSSAHILGFVGKNEEGEDKGYFGLEGFYDLSLTGKPGFVQRESDARGVPILIGDAKEIAAVRGVNLVTNIDKRVQFVVEEKLKKGIETYGAKSGVVIIMEPKTGAIKAMAAYPSYDPVEYYNFGNEFFKNPAISDSFEPGSIFKPLVMAAALDAGVIDVNTICDCSGPVKVDKYSIESWDKNYFPNSTMADIILHSDNVGMTFIGEKLGSDKLHDYLVNYGFGQLTGIDLQGEESPALRDKSKWNIVDQATATFGQGIAVTPIQMVQGFSAIANKGKVVSPQMVDKIVGDGWEEGIKSKKPRKVISEKAASEVTAMMVSAVKANEDKWSDARGFSIAGKTGTAQIPIQGHYDDQKSIASYIGFAPADEPKFVMLVSLREPTAAPWASQTAAPLWFSIARELFPYLGIQPDR